MTTYICDMIDTPQNNIDIDIFNASELFPEVSNSSSHTCIDFFFLDHAIYTFLMIALIPN